MSSSSSSAHLLLPRRYILRLQQYTRWLSFWLLAFTAFLPASPPQSPFRPLAPAHLPTFTLNPTPTHAPYSVTHKFPSLPHEHTID